MQASMTEDGQAANSGRCSGSFRLGNGADATGAIFEIELTFSRNAAPVVSVVWSAVKEAVPIHEREQTLSYINEYLQGYLKSHPIGALHVTVVSAGWFTDRRNELQRAAWIAIHKAITNLKLPPLRVFAPPTDADLNF